MPSKQAKVLAQRLTDAVGRLVTDKAKQEPPPPGASKRCPGKG